MATTTTEKPETSLHGPNLILDVKNFGPIAEAKDIEFKPMTVFLGPSNTGKTYLAMLQHAILDARTSESDNIRAFLRSKVGDSSENDILQSILLDLSRVIRENLTVPFGQPTKVEFKFTNLEPGTRRFLQNELDRRGHALREAIDSNLREIFEVAHWFDISNTAKSDLPSVQISINDGGAKLELDLVSRDSLLDVEGSKIAVESDFIWLVEHHRRELRSQSNPSFFVYPFEIAQFIELLFPSMPHSYYFPAGRTGILTAHRALTSSIIANASRMGIDFQETVSYHRLSAEFLGLLIDARDEQDFKLIKRGSLKKFDPQDFENVSRCAKVLEESLIDGQLEVRESVGVPEFDYVQGNLHVPIFRASSMVTEISPIVVILRNHVLPGDLLIIDEPEAHLHPEAQQQMAAALAFMVRSGLRVLITTHSHYMVEQLSAFVNASKLDETARKQALSLEGALGEEDIYLNEDETAVYSFGFSEEHGGSVVKEIFMGEEYEYGPDDHSDATVRQFNRLQRVLEARETAESNGMD